MAWTEALPRRARSAYERGRLLAAAREALLLLPFIGLAFVRCTHLTAGCVLSVVLIGLFIFLRWKGQVWGRAAVVGALVSLPGLVVPAVLGGCIGDSPDLLPLACGVFCPAIGLFAGGFLGVWCVKQGSDRNRALLSGGLTIAVSGALGCAVLGLAAIGGIWVGTVVATVGAVRLARA